MLIKIGVAGAKASVKAIGRVSTAITRAGASARASANNIAKFGSLIGVAFAGVALKQASQFGDKIREIQTISNGLQNNPGGLKDLSKNLRMVAGDFGQPIGAVAKAQYDIISAGVQDLDKAHQVLQESAKLAVAGVTDVGTTADLMTSALNAYSNTTLTASEASDILFMTVKQGKTTMTELGASLGQVMPFASSAGMSLETVGASMASITAKGVSTAEATTALKGAIIALDTPTKGARSAMENMGFEVSRTGDGLLDFEKTMEDLAGLDNEAIQRLIPNIRGQLAIKAIKADMEGFRANTEAFKDTAGSTDKAVQAMNNSFGQQSRMLKENLRNGLIEVGLAISESLVSEDGTGPLNKVNETLSAIGRIGWDEIGSRIYTNFQAIFSAVLQTIAILWGQVGQYALENFGQALQWVGDLVLSWASYVFEPVIIGAKIMAVKIVQGWKVMTATMGNKFTDMINGVLESYNDMIANSPKLAEFFGLGEATLMVKNDVQAIKDTYQSEIEDLKLQLANTQIIGDLASGVEGDADAIANVWAELKTKLLAENEETKADMEDLDETIQTFRQNVVSGQEDQGESSTNLANAENQAHASTLSGLRSQISGKLAQSIANFMANTFKTTDPLTALLISSAGAIAITSMFDQFIPKFAKGGSFITDRPGLIQVGDNPGGMERVTVEPLSSPGFQGGNKNVTVNISAPLVDETVRDSIMPEIQRALNQELA